MENDARFAARATVEGQAMFATLRLLAGGRNLVSYSGLWNWITESLRLGQGQSAEFRNAPRLLREGLVAPYLYGAQFMSYWQGTDAADSMPFGERLPRSSEQILHPERYVSGDRPIAVRFADGGGPVITEDVVGEFEDSELLWEFGGAGEGIFPVPTILEKHLTRLHRVKVLGRTDAVRNRFYAISVERRLKHPAVVAICETARRELFRKA